MNSICVVGRLTKDPELRFVQGSGKAVANFMIAVDNPFDKDNADFFRVVVWGVQAENLAKYKHKGNPVGVVGRLSSRTYDTANGEKRFVVEIIASNIDYLPFSKNETGGTSTTNTTQATQQNADYQAKKSNSEEIDIANAIANM